ncbi:hypothetical protein SEA_CONLEY_26 [Gordonia phage Conley]|nr:hypothetical protein SEA_CONLEY_26 [Gordonia phage Conley]
MLFNLNKPLRLAFLAESPALYVFASGVAIWRRTPVLTEYTADQTISFPDWARFIDFVGVGGGTSGQTGNGGNSVAGRGGNPGQWIGVTIERGVDIPWTAKQAVLTIGKGGAQAADNDFASANPGSASGTVLLGTLGLLLREEAEQGPKFNKPVKLPLTSRTTVTCSRADKVEIKITLRGIDLVALAQAVMVVFSATELEDMLVGMGPSGPTCEASDMVYFLRRRRWL